MILIEKRYIRKYVYFDYMKKEKYCGLIVISYFSGPDRFGGVTGFFVFSH